MMVPNTHDLIMEVMTSQRDTARVHESRMMLALTSYTVCASRQLHAMPAPPEQCPLSHQAHQAMLLHHPYAQALASQLTIPCAQCLWEVLHCMATQGCQLLAMCTALRAAQERRAPMAKHMRFRMGAATMQASTRGVTR